VLFFKMNEEAGVCGEKLYYESNRYNERHPCRECGTSNVFTRIYFHEGTLDSCYLCRNCAEQESRYRDYLLLTVGVSFSEQKK
jgi:hypothetical protein